MDRGIDAIDYNLNRIMNNGRALQASLGGVVPVKVSGGNTGTTILRPLKKGKEEKRILKNQ